MNTDPLTPEERRRLEEMPSPLPEPFEEETLVHEEPMPTHTNEPVEPIPPAAPPPPARRDRTGLKVLGWLLLILILFGGGFALAYFWLYQPAAVENRQLRSDLEAQTTEFNETRLELTQRSSELENLQTDLTSSSSDLDEAEIYLAINRLQNDILIARLALADNDEITARQAMRVAEDDLEDLRPVVEDATLVDDLAERLETAREALGSQNNRAEDTLRLLNENLALMADRLR